MGNMTGTASDEIEAPISEVWAVVEDMESAPEWQGGMEAMTVLERDDEGRAELVETESDASVRTIKSIVRFEYEPERRLTWRQEKGDLKSVVGSWELEDIGEGRTRATYSLDGDPGRMLGMLIRGPVEGKIREILVEGRPGELKEPGRERLTLSGPPRARGVGPRTRGCASFAGQRGRVAGTGLAVAQEALGDPDGRARGGRAGAGAAALWR